MAWLSNTPVALWIDVVKKNFQPLLGVMMNSCWCLHWITESSLERELLTDLLSAYKSRLFLSYMRTAVIVILHSIARFLSLVKLFISQEGYLYFFAVDSVASTPERPTGDDRQSSKDSGLIRRADPHPNIIHPATKAEQTRKASASSSSSPSPSESSLTTPDRSVTIDSLRQKEFSLHRTAFTCFSCLAIVLPSFCMSVFHSSLCCSEVSVLDVMAFLVGFCFQASKACWRDWW